VPRSSTGIPTEEKMIARDVTQAVPSMLIRRIVMARLDEHWFGNDRSRGEQHWKQYGCTHKWTHLQILPEYYGRVTLTSVR
jgi:hypothetical protein